MQKTVFFLFMLSLIPSLNTAYAGSGVGNGGVSIVCRDEANKIVEAQTLDIYEGELLYGQRFNREMELESLIGQSELKLLKFPKVYAEFKAELSKIKEMMVFIPVGHKLLPTDDALPKIQKENCNFEQLANYTNDSQLLVSSEIYDELDELNKASLLVHETVYALFRKHTGSSNSVLSRKLTAYLLAIGTEETEIAELVKNFNSLSSVSSCGTNGTISERMIDCRKRKGDYVLVMRSTTGNEIFKNIVTGKFWSDVSSQTMSFESAVSTCNDMENLLPGPIWQLPSYNTLKNAFNDLPNMKRKFWVTSKYVFDGTEGNLIRSNSEDTFYVRCIGLN